MNDLDRSRMAALIPILVGVVGVFIAVGLGVMVANEEIKLLLFLAGGSVAMAVVLILQRHIWLLIPLCWPLTGSISVLPLPFSVQELAVFMAFGMFCVQVAMKQFKGVKPQVDYLDLFIWLNLAVIFVMYIRNPVGVAAMGSELVGGRPYLKVIVGVMAFLVLSRIVIGPKLGYYFPIVTLGPNFLVAILNVTTQIFPFLTPIIAPFYSGINVASYVSEEFRGREAGGLDIQGGRYQGLARIGGPIIAALTAYNNPSKFLSPMNPKLFALFVFSVFCLGMSGFRSILFASALTVLIGAFLWERGIGLFKVMVLGIVGVVLIMSLQGVTELPRSIQRSLSFLPGPWNPDVVAGSKQSTDWRIEMWTIALTTDRYIEDKLLGDGFGFSKRDLAIMQSGGLGGQGFMGADQHMEAFMIQGSYHSGPVSTIRFAGVLGLVMFLGLRFAMLAYSWRLLKQAWHTPFRPMVILATVSAIYSPFAFIVIFGEYRDDLPTALYACGMLKLIANSLKAYLAEQKQAADASDAAALLSKPAPVPA